MTTRDWTMKRFVRWAFGPAPLFEGVRLLHRAQCAVDNLRQQPGDPEVLRTLAKVLHALREMADTNRWKEEGDTFAHLSRVLSWPADPAGLVRPLRTGLFAAEQKLRNRLASAALLAEQQPATPEAPVERDAPEIERVA
ncbi:MAG TPA: hypothetical protein VI139_09410 [Gemmatimonadales bacterium]